MDFMLNLPFQHTNGDAQYRRPTTTDHMVGKTRKTQENELDGPKTSNLHNQKNNRNIIGLKSSHLVKKITKSFF